MPKFTYLLLICLAGSPVASGAQDHDEHGEHRSAYAAQEPSGIAALSLRELGDLTSGSGMGLARAAELNHYPGPKHVLELATELNLSDEQQARTEEIRVEMIEEAKRVGKEIVEKERILDRRFSHRHIDESTLRRLTSEISSLYGELRFIHMSAHLQLASVLEADQVEAYDSLRGYGRE